MTGPLRIRTRKNVGYMPSLHYATIWTAWLDDKMLGQGCCRCPEEAVEWVHDLVTPDQVEHVEIREA